MITHTSPFETLANAPVKQTDVIVVRQSGSLGSYTDDNTMKWTSSTVLMSANVDVVGGMLGAATKKAVVKLLGIVSGISANELFQIRYGVYDISAFVYISQGFFKIDTIDYDYDAQSTTVTLYDHMWTASETMYADVVTSGDLTYPATVEAFAGMIAGKLGVNLMSGFSSLPNSQYSILADLYSTISSATLQVVIQEIAGATGTTARISDYTLVFSQYSLSAENLTSSNLKTLKIGNQYGPINSLILGRVPQNDNIALFTQNIAPKTVTANATTNLFTATDHHLVDGDLVQFSSTGTVPAPLVASTSYYVYTNANATTFAVAPTYSQAIAGTGLIDLTTAGTGTITVTGTPTQEIQINNNEILDDDRETLISPLYNKLSGIYWNEVKSDTVGLGWHEVGDVISFTQGAKIVRAFLTEVHLTLGPGVKEQLVSTIPDPLALANQQTAGGVLKTLYNAEIKVDKQANEITSIVSEQQIVNDQVQEDFTEIRQDVDSIDINIQNAGGNNLLQNSVGYATDDGLDDVAALYTKLYAWNYYGLDGVTQGPYIVAEHGTVDSQDSSASQNLGGVSGRALVFDIPSGKGIRLKQEDDGLTDNRIGVAVGAPLSLGVRVYNTAGAGTGKITLSNTNESFEISIPSTTQNWVELKVENFVTTLPWLEATIEAKADGLQITDLTLMYGVTLQKWTQSDTESMSANVQFTKDGIRVYDPDRDMETRITNSDFQTIRSADGTVLFEADDTGVRANDFTIRGSSDYYTAGQSVIKQITIPLDDPKGGIAFLKGTE